MEDDLTKLYQVYIIECEDGSYYTGIALDPVKRFEVHKSGKGAKYTRSHKPKKLVAVLPEMLKSQALKTEYAIKQLSHVEKECLIEWVRAATFRDTVISERLEKEGNPWPKQVK